MSDTAGPSPYDEKTSRLEILHAALFTLGMTLAAAGFFAGKPRLLLVAGPCIALSAVLIWFGLRVKLRGVFGDLLRVALGPTRFISMQLRALTWLLVGLAITGWAVARLSCPAAEEPLPPPAQLSIGGN